MNILIYLAHPAHFHLFKNSIKTLKIHGHSITVTIKKKDVLENLLIENSIRYINILSKGRKPSKFGVAKGLFLRSYSHYKIIKKNNFDLVLSSSAELGLITRLLNIPFVNVFEDDLTLFPVYSKLLIPLADLLLVPQSCNTEKWINKTINYRGNQELAYLHPKNFQPKKEIASKYLDLKKNNYIIRFAKLDAWHDTGKTGLTEVVFNKIVSILEPFGNILVTSEIDIKKEYEKYKLNIPASEMHHILAYCNLYIGDSQTMTAEAAVLGTPSIRFNDFVGKIGYLEELEKKYELSFGVETENPEKLYSLIKELLNIPNLKEVFQKRRMEFLSNVINVADFLTWFIETYPQSKQTMLENPDYQNRFLD